MHTIESALREAFAELVGGPEQLEKILKRARFERAVEEGQALLAEATTATRENRLYDALAVVRKNRYACAACIADDLSRRRKRYVPVSGGFAELEQMELLWKQKLTEQERQKRQQAQCPAHSAA